MGPHQPGATATAAAATTPGVRLALLTTFPERHYFECRSRLSPKGSLLCGIANLSATGMQSASWAPWCCLVPGFASSSVFV